MYNDNPLIKIFWGGEFWCLVACYIEEGYELKSIEVCAIKFARNKAESGYHGFFSDCDMRLEALVEVVPT